MSAQVGLGNRLAYTPRLVDLGQIEDPLQFRPLELSVSDAAQDALEIEGTSEVTDGLRDGGQ